MKPKWQIGDIVELEMPSEATLGKIVRLDADGRPSLFLDMKGEVLIKVSDCFLIKDVAFIDTDDCTHSHPVREAG